MSNPTFLLGIEDGSETQNPNPYLGHYTDHELALDNHDHRQNLELFNHIALAARPDEEYSTSDISACTSQTPASQDLATPTKAKCENRVKMNVESRVAFRTKSNLDVMDDGFKWRKYGKKKVKSSPNPRNYFKCTSEGCGVKKRVERDAEDSSYVITTYEGMHNHESHCCIYYNEVPFSLHMDGLHHGRAEHCSP